MHLLSPIALALVSQVLDFGAEKYGENNWRKGIHIDKLLDAIERHTMAMKGGEVVDRETGLPHAAHIMTEAMFITELETSTKRTVPSCQYTKEQQDLLTSLLANKHYRSPEKIK